MTTRAEQFAPLPPEFLAPVVESDAIAEGWIVQRGRSIVFCEAEVRDHAGEVAATASLTFKVSSRPANY